MATFRAAVIGLGRMGSTFDDEIERGGCLFLPFCHAPSYMAAPNVELVAGVDPHPEQRQLFGQRWGLEDTHLYDDHQQMLEREKPDLVSVCTSARHRSRIVQDVAASGVRGIWAEKPVALSLAEADAMLAACGDHGVVLAVNCARRWSPLFCETRRLVEEGELGSVLQVTAMAQCGLSHNGSHAIDTIRYLAGGQIEWVFGEMESDEKAATDHDLSGNGYLAFDNGVRAYLRALPTGLAQWEFDVIGTEGRVRSISNGLEFELWKPVAGGPRAGTQPGRVPFPVPARPEGMGLTIIDDIIHCVEEGGQPRCSGEDGRAALEVALALRESHRRGGTRVPLPLEDRSLVMRSAEIAQDEVPTRIRRERAARG
ncbi:Gfo/Idh/MocA family protein [Candidatus Latescibacterota bacterium]